MAEPVTTVITPAVSRSLVTLENLKLDLGIAVDTDDEFLTRAIAKASAIVETYCGRVFSVETVQDVFAAPNGSSLTLSRQPLVSVGSVTGDLVQGVDYTYSYGRLRLAAGYWGADTEIVYTAGYATIPLEVQAAVGELVKTFQFNRSRDPLLKSENILSGLYAYTLADGNSAGAGTAKQVEMLLDPYRAVLV